MRTKLLAVALVAALTCNSTADANDQDFSPDATGAIADSAFFNSLTFPQTIGESFLITSPTEISGGAFYGLTGGTTGTFGLGSDVQFAIFEDAGGLPSSVPLVDELTVVDAYDTAGASTAQGLSRYHATLANSVVLGPGTYYFSLVGVNDEPTAAASSVGYDDAGLWFGQDLNIDLEGGFAGVGDVFFQLDTAKVPEPSSLVIVGLIAGIAANRRRR